MTGCGHLAGNHADVGDRLRQSGNHRDQRLHQLVLRRALAEVHGQVSVCDLIRCRGDLDHGGDHRVQVVLDQIEIPLIRVGDLWWIVALADTVHASRGHVERPDYGVQHLVDALHDLAVVALMFAGIGAGGQLAFQRGLNQQNRIGDKGVDGVDAGVQVVLDQVEVALIGVGDLGGNISLADLFHIFRGNL